MFYGKPRSEMTPEELEAESEDWTADLLTIAAGEEAMAKARAQRGDSLSPAIPESLFRALEHL